MVTLGSDTTLSRVQDLWARVLEHIRGSIQPKQFDLWFRRIRVVDLDDQHITLEVPNRFFRDWVRSFYLTSIAKAVEVESGRQLDVEFLIASDPDLPEPEGWIEKVVGQFSVRRNSLEGTMGDATNSR